MSGNKDVLFIGGHRKGGTTLLVRLLDDHPALNVYPGDLITLYAYFPQYIREERTAEQLWTRLEDVAFRDLRAYFASKYPDRMDDLRAMRSRLRGLLVDEDLKDIVKVLNAQIASFEQAFGKQGARWNVVKETSIEINAGMLLQGFPGSRFIQVIRDPRDNYAALKAGVGKYYSGFGDTDNTVLMSMIHRYGMGAKACLVNQKRFGAGRYHMVRHEDVVTATRTQMQGISDFLGVDFSTSMLQPSELGREVQSNTYEKQDMRSVSSANVGRWRERITDLEACIVEFFFKDVMEVFGYECAFAETEQLEAAAEFYQWSNHKYFYFDRFS